MATSWAELREADTGRVLAARLEVADTAWKRAIGLMGRAELTADSGLWLEPCNGIHTFFLRFPIDVLFLDAGGAVLRAVPNLCPWRIGGPVRGARVVIELPAGTISAHNIRVGSRLFLQRRPQGTG